MSELTDNIQWNPQGLAPAVVQDARSGAVLMLAWVNAESLRCTVAEQRPVFWSRSRQALWRKGESSGNVQKLVELRLDCDGDTLLMQVEQQGPACHTGRANCFYRQWTGEGWDSTEPVVRSPEEMYGSGA